MDRLHHVLSSPRSQRVASVGVLVVGALLSVPSVVSGAPMVATADQCLGAIPDFNGDGCPDLAVGAPHSRVDGQVSAGLVEVLYGDASGAFTQPRLVLTQGGVVGGAAEAGDEFGAVLDARKVNDDPYWDLEVGVPREDIGAVEDAGAVFVIYGSANGLGGGLPSRVVRQGRGVGTGVPETGDQFGAALASGVIGIPGEDIGAVRDAGAVYAAGRTWSQAGPAVAGDAEAGDRFGSAVVGLESLCGGDAFAVGVPGEDVGAIRDAGAIVTIGHVGRTEASCAFSSVFISQDTKGMPGVSEAGDRFGSALAFLRGVRSGRLIVGVPGEDLGALGDAGVIQVVWQELGGPFSSGGFLAQHQTAGASEAGDQFGATLVAEQIATDDIDRPNLAVGVPGEDVGRAVDAGAVVRMYLTWNAEDYPNWFELETQEDISSGAETSEAGDRFGASLGIAESANGLGMGLYAGSPGEDRGEFVDLGTVLGPAVVATPLEWDVASQFGAAVGLVHH